MILSSLAIMPSLFQRRKTACGDSHFQSSDHSVDVNTTNQTKATLTKVDEKRTNTPESPDEHGHNAESSHDNDLLIVVPSNSETYPNVYSNSDQVRRHLSISRTQYFHCFRMIIPFIFMTSFNGLAGFE
jgi:hypothetical protein